MEFKYKICKERFIVRDREGTFTLEEAESIVDKYLEEQDSSSGIKFNEEIVMDETYKLDATYSIAYNYNIIEYKHKLEGFTFNIGIIVWNKDTKEYRIKVMEDEHLKKILSVMPGLWFMGDLITILKEVKFEDIEDLRRYINDNFGNNSYPKTYYFKYPLSQMVLDHKNNKEDINIDDTIDRQYEWYIGCNFEE